MAATAVFVLAAPLVSDGQEVGQPDPKEILLRAGSACRALRAIEYDLEQALDAKTPGNAAVTRVTIRQARVDVPTAGFLPGKYAVTGTIQNPDGRTERVAHAYNGTVFRSLSEKKRTVFVIERPQMAAVSRVLDPTVVLLGLPQFTDANPFVGHATKAAGLAYEGIVEVRGVRCHKVAVTLAHEHPTRGTIRTTSRWAFGVADGLPRLFETAGGMASTLRITRLDPDFDEAVFTVAAPAGYGESPITGMEPKAEGLLGVGSDAPDWSLKGPEGRQHTLGEMRGRVVVLDFWGTWCVPCIRAMPALQRLHDRYAGRGVSVVGVDVYDKDADPAGFMKARGFSYQILLNGDEVASLYRAQVFPTIYVIGPDGKILHAEFGYREGAHADIEAIIERALAKRAGEARSPFHVAPSTRAAWRQADVVQGWDGHR